MNLSTERPTHDNSALVALDVTKWHHSRYHHCQDEVAEEVGVALEYNGISHAVMLASPTDLEDFALGFSLSEGIISSSSELFDCDIEHTCDGIVVQLRIATARFEALKGQRRNMTGRTGCGLCGAETLQQALRHPGSVQCTAMFTPATVHAGMQAMQQQQRLQQHTGATHAAAWMDSHGQVQFVREDIGRHNALDKLIGTLARHHIDTSTGAALITSRASVEMVQKAATAGIGFLAAISAPTSMAVKLAQQTQLTLVGFVRRNNNNHDHTSHVIYSHGQRCRD